MDVPGGMTDELLVALTARNQALDTLDAVVGPLRGQRRPSSDAVLAALDGAYEASDAAHLAVREALASMHRAARLQRDALRVAHLAVMIATDVPVTMAPPAQLR